MSYLQVSFGRHAYCFTAQNITAPKLCTGGLLLQYSNLQINMPLWKCTPSMEGISRLPVKSETGQTILKLQAVSRSLLKAWKNGETQLLQKILVLMYSKVEMRDKR